MPVTPRKFSITLPQKVADELEALAAREGRTKANLATFAVELYIRAASPEVFKPVIRVDGLEAAKSRQ